MTSPTPPGASSAGASSPDETRRLLAERYGAPDPRRRRLVIAAVTLVAAAGLVWLAWAAWWAAGNPVDAEVVSFEVTSPHQMTVEVAIRRDSGDAVTCTVIAQASDRTVVGESRITLPAGDSGEHRVEKRLVTERAAATADVADCY